MSCSVVSFWRKNMPGHILMLFALLCFSSAYRSARADSCVVPMPGSADVRAFTESVIDAFEYFQRSRDTFARLNGAKDPGEAFQILAKAQDEAQCAESQLDRYATSSNAAMMATAQQAQSVSLGLTAADEDFTALLKGQFNGDSDEKQEDKARRVEKMGTDARNAWELVPKVASSACSALLEPAADSQFKRVLLTTRQRADLAERIRRHFPKVKAAIEAAVEPVDESARMLYRLLTDSKVKSRDAPAYP